MEGSIERVESHGGVLLVANLWWRDKARGCPSHHAEGLSQALGIGWALIRLGLSERFGEGKFPELTKIGDSCSS